MKASPSLSVVFTLAAIFAVSAFVVAAPPRPTPSLLIGVLNGHVVDLSGDPVQGATVHIADASSGLVVARFETDTAGMFQAKLTVGRYEARAGKNYFPSVRKLFTIQTAKPITLKLVLQERPAPSSGFAQGQLLDLDGNAVEGAVVYVESSATGELVTKFTTDKTGTFKLELKPGMYLLTAGKNQFPSATLRFEIIAGKLTEFDVVLMEKP